MSRIYLAASAAVAVGVSPERLLTYAHELGIRPKGRLFVFSQEQVDAMKALRLVSSGRGRGKEKR